MTILAEFVNRNNGNWIGDTAIAAPNLAPATVNGELVELQLLVEYRPEVMAEALAQMNDMVGYWAGTLMFSRSSHPWTFRLARTAIVVGEFVAMYLEAAVQPRTPLAAFARANAADRRPGACVLPKRACHAGLSAVPPDEGGDGRHDCSRAG